MRKKKLFRLLIGLFFFFILISSNAIFLRLLQLKKVYIIASHKINKGFEIFNNQNLLFMDTKNIQQYLVNNNLEIKSLTIEKSYPQSLILQINYREPIAYLDTESAKYYIDEEGILMFTRSEETVNLPVIKISKSNLSPFQKADWRIINALSFIKYCQKEGILIDQILIDQNKPHFHLYLTGNTEVIVPQTGDAHVLAASLQIIISRFRIEGKIVTRVDFQFDKPIVVFLNGENFSSN